MTTYWVDTSILTGNFPGNSTFRFFSASPQNCLCFLSFCLVGVQLCWWIEVLQGVLPNLLVSTLMCNLSECSWRQLWAHEPDIWRSFARNSRQTENRCSEMPKCNKNKCKIFDVCWKWKHTFLRLISWNHPGRWLCVTPMLRLKYDLIARQNHCNYNGCSSTATTTMLNFKTKHIVDITNLPKWSTQNCWKRLTQSEYFIVTLKGLLPAST